jgi:uncharacterized SAM-binding protein YcdF (DUF218 family)
MFFILSKILSFLIKPVIWIFILLVFILKEKAKKSIYLLLFVFYFFSNSYIVDSVSKQWEINPKNISDLSSNYKYGIVLGGFSSYNKDVKHIDFNEFSDRLITAIELYNLQKIDTILISGGNGLLINDGMKESEWTYNFLLNFGVDSNRIIIENRSRNTMENASYTADIINDNKETSLLITSAVHMRRAKMCFSKNNITVDVFTTDNTSSDILLTFDYLLIPNSVALKKWEFLIHEWIGFMIYKIKF